MSTAGIILAAGFSRRLGRPKQVVEIGGETLLQRTIRVAAQAELQPLIAVLRAGAGFDALAPATHCEVVLNDEAEEGIAASIRVGVRALEGRPGIRGAVILLCDQVLLTAEHIGALSAEPDRVAASWYAGKRAVPAYFPRERFSDLLKLQGDTGARDLLRAAHAIAAEPLALDIDTEEDVARATEYFAARDTAPD